MTYFKTRQTRTLIPFLTMIQNTFGYLPEYKSLMRAIVRGFGVFRCSIYYVTNYIIDEQGAQRNITINGLFHNMVKS